MELLILHKMLNQKWSKKSSPLPEAPFIYLSWDRKVRSITPDYYQKNSNHYGTKC